MSKATLDGIASFILSNKMPLSILLKELKTLSWSISVCN